MNDEDFVNYWSEKLKSFSVELMEDAVTFCEKLGLTQPTKYSNWMLHLRMKQIARNTRRSSIRPTKASKQPVISAVNK